MDTTFLEDLPSGPLDEYRRQANFSWKNLKLAFERADLYKLKLRIWKTLENDPIFRRPAVEPTAEEMKKITSLQFHQYYKYNFLPADIINWPYQRKTRVIMTVNEAIAVCFPNISVKYAVGNSLFTNSLLSLGTERHQQIFRAVWDKKILACLALTEVAHGSNTKQMRTMATFDKNTQEFVINTPDFQAAKCWVGNLGKTCTVALLFAQLHTDGQCHGLHAFIVPIRDPQTLLPYPGILVGDIGEKAGLNGIDNGFIMFQNYRIPRENLLNRTADVTPDGDYESSFSDPGKILGAALENLSTGRVGIMQECTNNLACAVTISIRYAAVRKQFGENGKEMSIIEYPLHQWRLFPYVASASVYKMFLDEFTNDYLMAVEQANTSASTRIESLGDLVAEIHAIISAAKPVISWTSMQAIQESREACGGHGYLKGSRLGELRNSSDPSVTYEGDNNVLIQQTSNWLLRQWGLVLSGQKVCSPLQTCTFLSNYTEILQRKFRGSSQGDVLSFNFVLDSYEWLITFLISVTHERQKECLAKGFSKFFARNHTQVYKAGVLSKAYCEYLAVRYFCKKVSQVDSTLKDVLGCLGLLYGLSCIDKHLIYFYQGCYAEGSQLIELVREAILHLCSKLKPNIVSVIDGLAPPDYIVNSILGKADGKVYEHLQQEFFSNPDAMSRPDWWHEIIIKDAPDIKFLSKL